MPQPVDVDRERSPGRHDVRPESLRAFGRANEGGGEPIDEEDGIVVDEWYPAQTETP